MTLPSHAVEAGARAMCACAGRDPDKLEPGDVPAIDGTLPNGDPADFLWRDYSDKAEKTIQAALAAEGMAWRDMETAPKDRQIFVRGDTGCGMEYAIVWWDHTGHDENYPWLAEINAYPIDRWDEWMDPEAIPTASAGEKR